MTRLFASLRWRYVRWAALAAVIPVLWACNARKLADPNPATKGVEKNVFVQTLNRDIDMIFMIDNSSSMTPMQALLVQNLPQFMDVLKGLEGGLPNLRVAVVSSSMGAGIWGDVPGCFQVPEQNDDGQFRSAGVNPPGCMGPNNNGSYLIANAANMNNFAGDISAAFSCIAAIGDMGCGFEHQFRSVEAALQRSFAEPPDPNSGFLRQDAYLAVIMLTNEDDCSIPWDSMLLDPRQSHVSDPLGGLQTGYRCNEFGHLCDGGPPPHTVTGDTPLQNCRSAEGAGRLIPVSQFVESLKSFKQDPINQIFVAALAGPVTPYIVELRQNVMTTDGSIEAQPAIAHSCGPRVVMPNSQTVFADPSIRIKEWVDAFGDHGVFENICTANFGTAMARIATELSRIIGPQCLQNAVAQVEPDPNNGRPQQWMVGGGGTPDCQVSLRQKPEMGTTLVEKPVPLCAPGRTNATADAPCWQIITSNQCMQEMQVCYNAGCTVDARPANAVNAQVACALFLPP